MYIKLRDINRASEVFECDVVSNTANCKVGLLTEALPETFEVLARVGANGIRPLYDDELVRKQGQWVYNSQRRLAMSTLIEALQEILILVVNLDRRKRIYAYF